MKIPKHCKVAHNKLYHAATNLPQPDWRDRKAVRDWKETHALLNMCMEQVFVEMLSKAQ